MEIVIGGNSFVALEHNQKKMGKVDSNIVEKLKAFSINEQVENLYIENYDCKFESEYGIDDDTTSTYTTALNDMEIESAIVKNGVIVALNVVVYKKSFTAFINKQVCTYMSSEDDGPYSCSVYDHITLKSKLLEK